ncbi:unnamed protein product [Closterium sp. Naga37s-1]|nr:unnamed protein product [Closterium sp. Naga37s-1]
MHTHTSTPERHFFPSPLSTPPYLILTHIVFVHAIIHTHIIKPSLFSLSHLLSPFPLHLPPPPPPSPPPPSAPSSSPSPVPPLRTVGAPHSIRSNAFPMSPLHQPSCSFSPSPKFPHDPPVPPPCPPCPIPPTTPYAPVSLSHFRSLALHSVPSCICFTVHMYLSPFSTACFIVRIPSISLSLYLAIAPPIAPPYCPSPLPLAIAPSPCPSHLPLSFGPPRRLALAPPPCLAHAPRPCLSSCLAFPRSCPFSTSTFRFFSRPSHRTAASHFSPSLSSLPHPSSPSIPLLSSPSPLLSPPSLPSVLPHRRQGGHPHGCSAARNTPAVACHSTNQFPPSIPSHHPPLPLGSAGHRPGHVSRRQGVHSLMACHFPAPSPLYSLALGPHSPPSAQCWPLHWACQHAAGRPPSWPVSLPTSPSYFLSPLNPLLPPTSLAVLAIALGMSAGGRASTLMACQSANLPFLFPLTPQSPPSAHFSCSAGHRTGHVSRRQGVHPHGVSVCQPPLPIPSHPSIPSFRPLLLQCWPSPWACQQAAGRPPSWPVSLPTSPSYSLSPLNPLLPPTPLAVLAIALGMSAGGRASTLMAAAAEPAADDVIALMDFGFTGTADNDGDGGPSPLSLSPSSPKLPFHPSPTLSLPSPPCIALPRGQDDVLALMDFGFTGTADNDSSKGAPAALVVLISWMLIDELAAGEAEVGSRRQQEAVMWRLPGFSQALLTEASRQTAGAAHNEDRDDGGNGVMGLLGEALGKQGVLQGRMQQEEQEQEEEEEE